MKDVRLRTMSEGSKPPKDSISCTSSRATVLSEYFLKTYDKGNVKPNFQVVR
jgi:hypothetical protein